MSSPARGSPRNSCLTCGEVFSSPHKCEYHRRLNHQNLVSVTFNDGTFITFERSGNGYFLCPQCPNWRHQNPATLQNHCRNNHPNGFNRHSYIEQPKPKSEVIRTPIPSRASPEVESQPIATRPATIAPINSVHSTKPIVLYAKPIIPHFYYYILGVFEPAITIAGAINAAVFQINYMQGLSPGPVTDISVPGQAVLYQLGNMYLVLALVIIALWHVTQDLIILQLFEFVLAVGDVGHIIATIVPYGFSMLLRPYSWSIFVTTNIVMSLFLLGIRLAFLGNFMFNIPVQTLKKRN